LLSQTTPAKSTRKQNLQQDTSQKKNIHLKTVSYHKAQKPAFEEEKM